MRFWVMGTVALTLAICASAQAGDPEKEKAKLQGTWTLTKVVIRGEDKTDLFKDWACTFAGDKVTFKVGSEAHEGKFKIVEATKKPKQINVSIPKQPDSPSIYEIDGDVLKIGVGEKGSARPGAFDAKDIMVMTFKKSSK